MSADPFSNYITYEGRSGDYWDKSTCTITTRGEWLLDEASDCVFGEPAVRSGTGTVSTPSMKRTCVSYPSGVNAGASGVLGVFIDYKRDISAFTAELYALLGSHHRARDVLLVLRGPVRIKNVGSTYIYTTQDVIPADGGCESMTDEDAEHKLGKALQDIPAGKYGLVYVDPEYEISSILP